jgi:hypothetical protein
MNKKINEFLNEIEKICEKYDISIWSEDGFNGAFILRKFDQDFMNHLKEAKIDEE